MPKTHATDLVLRRVVRLPDYTTGKKPKSAIHISFFFCIPQHTQHLPPLPTQLRNEKSEERKKKGGERGYALAMPNGMPKPTAQKLQ